MKETKDYTKEFQTPAAVCNYMVSLLPDGTRSVLEPTPGVGNIVSALNKKGFEVTAPQDYFLLDRSLKFDGVVCNLPFSSKYMILDNAPDGFADQGMAAGYKMLFECMEKSDVVIALMPMFTISDSDVRLRFLKRWGLKSMTLLPRKTFDYTRVQTIILELRKGYQGVSEFIVYDTIKDAA